MKYTTLLILLFLFIFNTNAQTNSGLVTYGQYIGDFIIDTTSIDNTHVKNVLVSQYREMKNALSEDVDVYKLEFKDNLSRFEALKYMDSDFNSGYKMAISKGIYYVDIIRNKIQHENFFSYISKQLVINYNTPNYNWVIEDEKKLISGFECQKAFTIIENTGGVKSKVTAWFTQDINLNFGPKQYFGLPGLIIELHELESVYYFRSIKFKDVELNTTKKGEEISYDDYLKMVNGVSRF